MNDPRLGEPLPLSAMRGMGPYDDGGMGVFDVAALLASRWRSILGLGAAGALLAFGASWLIPPTFTARTTFLAPQQQQNATVAALNQLSALAGMAGGGNLKSPADQYAALMQSVTVTNRIVERFNLKMVYDAKFLQDARAEFGDRLRISAGKKDGIIAVEVDDTDPQRAADMANSLIDELRQLTNTIAVSEAQVRREFFDQQLRSTQDRLTKAQISLQGSGINQGALKAEPRAAAEGYAKLKAEVTAAEVRLQALRRVMADDAPEVQQQRTVVEALRRNLASLEQRNDPRGDSEYVTRYREFKYQETLFELFARQYELARLDESREGALIQVIDQATAPERKSRPRRAVIAVVAALASILLASIVILLRHTASNQDARLRGAP